ncbi:MAG: response regulator [Rhodoblastus sp.]|nr:MAG: response regulator [Rhodoblastus sp.]
MAEDEPLVAMEIEDVILEHGAIPVGPFASLSELMAAIEEGGYDVAILDVRLGRDESFPAADRLRKKGVPFIFIPAMPTAAIFSAPIPRRRCAKSPARRSACLRPP